MISDSRIGAVAFLWEQQRDVDVEIAIYTQTHVR